MLFFVTLYLIPRACSLSRYNQTCLKRAVSLGDEPGTPEHAGDAITDGSGYCVEPAPTHEQSPSLSSKTRLLTSPSFQTDTYLQVDKEDSPVKCWLQRSCPFAIPAHIWLLHT